MTLTTRVFAGFVAIAGIGVLGLALLSQYWGGLAPCELCLLQRWPWTAAIALALLAWLVNRDPALPWLALLLAVIFATGAMLAAYHVAVEQHWIAGPTACTAQAGGALTLEDMKRQILGTAPVLCDRVQWSLVGVSLAGWNLLASLVMVAACAVAFLRSRRPSARAAAAA